MQNKCKLTEIVILPIIFSLKMKNGKNRSWFARIVVNLKKNGKKVIVFERKSQEGKKEINKYMLRELNKYMLRGWTLEHYV